MKATRLLTAVFLALGLIGCPHNEYTLEVKPDQDVLVRTLHVTRVADDQLKQANYSA
ncbi:hypothetical protein LCGC14_2120500, partial [marine sediment metagenome]